ncbi:MAG: hypothetical protein MUE54_04310 [Anaerolineae bacterium]|jgi:fumarate hydratase class II|nr:hypothetical protein [Anaerolineae bacterium]
MDYKTVWLIENDVVLMIPYGDLTPNDGVKMIQSASDLINTSLKDKVAVIADITHLSSPAPNIIEAFKLFKNRSPKWGFTIIIGQKDLKRIIAQAVLQTARVDVRFAKDMNEALQILYRVVPELVGKAVNQIH